ncbi:MAG: PHB depolymerase family esterase [Bacteroidota bacterium]
MKKQVLFLSFLLLLFCFNTKAQTNSSFIFEGQNRSFIVYTPASYTSGNPVPLVFVLHGLTQSGQAIMNVSNFNAVADTAGFILVYPEGISNSWNINANLPGASTANDIGFIQALIDTISVNYSIDQNRIYSCGFSAGGFMSHMLACKSSHCFAAIASVSGTMTDSVYNTCSPSFHLPIMQIHGTSDNIVSFNGSLGNKSVDDVINFWKNFNACNASPVITPFPNTSLLDFSSADLYDYSPCQNNNKVALIKVNSGGHQWPGTSSLLGGLGTINMDINASAEIWKFFRNYSCNSSTQGLNNLTNEWVSLQPLSPNDYLLKGTAGNIIIQVYSSNGQLIEKQSVSLPYSMSFANYKSGLYLINVQSGVHQNTFKIIRP